MDIALVLGVRIDNPTIDRLQGGHRSPVAAHDEAFPPRDTVENLGGTSNEIPHGDDGEDVGFLHSSKLRVGCDSFRQATKLFDGNVEQFCRA